MHCLKRLTRLSLERNHLSGPFPQWAVDGMSSLRELRLSFNGFSGPLPTFPASLPLERVYLDHNRFSGAFGPQIRGFAQHLSQESFASLNLDHNELSGNVPDAVYRMLHDAHGLKAASSWHITMIENHLLCEPGGTDWQEWVLRAGGQYFGRCTPATRCTPARRCASAAQTLRPLPSSGAC